MDPFTLIMFGLIGLFLVWIVILGTLSPRRSTAIVARRGSARDPVRPPRQALCDDTSMQETLQAINERRRREGRAALPAEEIEARTAAAQAEQNRRAVIVEENLRRQRGKRPRLTPGEAGRFLGARERATGRTGDRS